MAKIMRLLWGWDEMGPQSPRCLTPFLCTCKTEGGLWHRGRKCCFHSLIWDHLVVAPKPGATRICLEDEKASGKDRQVHSPHPGSVHQSSCPSKREEKAAFLLKRSSKPEREQEGYNVPQKPFQGGYIREYDICSQMNRRHALWIKENVCLRPQWFRWAQHPDFHRYGRKKPLFVDDCVKSTDTFLSPDISQAESGWVSTDARLWSNWHFSLVETFSDWIVFL